MLALRIALPLLIALAILLPGPAPAQDTAASKKQIAFLNRGLEERLQTIRQQLRDKKLDLARANIQQVTEVLKEIGRLTQDIRKGEPGYSPNPPIDFDSTPATGRQMEFAAAKKMALDLGKKLNQQCQAANEALLKAKNRQMATIAISALKFTVENAPGRPGGELTEFAVEGMKRLNSYLMDTYIAAPITNNLSEVQLLKDNFVSIADGARLLKVCEDNRKRVVDLAKQLDAEGKAAKGPAEAERAWQAYRWLKEAGAGTLQVQVVDLQARALELSLNGVVLTPAAKGKTFSVPSQVILTARVKDERRKFCLDKRAYAQKTKTITVLPGPGGGDEDSLVYTSSTMGGKSSWLIKDETFDWQPSGNTSLEDDPKAVNPVYWKLQKSRVRWKLPAKAGEQVNVFVKGKIQWEFDQVLPSKKDRKQEQNDGTATLVLKII